MRGFDIALNNELNLKSTNTSNTYRNETFQGDNTTSWFMIGELFNKQF